MPKEMKRLKEMKSQCPDQSIRSHLNINSIHNKLDALFHIIDNNLDILMISETKLDDSFLKDKLFLPRCSAPSRFDRKSKGGEILLKIREDIPSRLFNTESKIDIETISAEINLRKRK